MIFVIRKVYISISKKEASLRQEHSNSSSLSVWKSFSKVFAENLYNDRPIDIHFYTVITEEGEVKGQVIQKKGETKWNLVTQMPFML